MPNSRQRLPGYYSWSSMKSRCYNKNNADYNYYGGRGITVCDSWLNSYENFISDMGAKPSNKHSLDRIDNDKGYSPENCRWASPSEQRYNRRMWAQKNKTGCKGVRQNIHKWQCIIGINGMRYFLGSFKTKEEAAIAYDTVAYSWWGDKAVLNFPDVKRGIFDR